MALPGILGRLIGKRYDDAKAAAKPDVFDEWKAEVEAVAKAHPLDHDGDGKPGGSLPKAKRKKRAE